MNEYILKAIKDAPILSAPNKILTEAWQLALRNLLEISTVDCPPETYNRTGLWEASPGLMIRAGGGYPTPWTRDAAVNTMNAACFLEPEAAKNTLWAVCERVDGKLCFQMDNQSWDKVVWTLGAWNYYLATGDILFLKEAYETVKNSISMLEKTQYNEAFGLFTGGSFFNDGITGYPKKLHQKGNESSFVGDHPAVASVMTLSTNCLYYRAYQILAKMVRKLQDADALKLEQYYLEKAENIKTAVNRWLWMEEKNTYAYLVYPNGEVDGSQEGCGLSFALLFEVCDRKKAEYILQNVQVSGCGLVSVWPPFEEISSLEKPLRHNNLIWPFVNGFFADAAAKYGRADLLETELRNIAEMAVESRGFYEIYNPQTGKPDGGWQCGGHWDSVSDQTWSATGFIRMVVYGLFGVDLQEDGIVFRPCVPDCMRPMRLDGLRIRGVEMDLILHEKTGEELRILINKEEKNRINFSAPGKYCVEYI